MAVAAPLSRLRSIPLTRTQWVFLSLLVISICINYINRGSLSVADRYLQNEFALDPERRGLIYSAFFWTYAGFQILAGWLVSLIHISEPTIQAEVSYAVFCLKKKNN